ncbi:MAG: polymer-forming cytoskeletal protein [Sulfurifustaceae bacterium]
MKIGTKLFGRKKNRRSLDRIEFGTVLGEHAVYRGDLTGEANYLVKGEVRGRCEIVGHLVLQQTACWNGDISATHVVIAGEVIGDVYASAKLELQSTARIRGDIASPVIALAQGALYEGAIRRRPRAQITRFTEKRSG